MTKTEIKEQKRYKRKIRIRKNLIGTLERPRLTIFRSLNHIYAQIVDDTNGSTIVSASTLSKEIKDKQLKGKKSLATEVGKLIAERAKTNGITKVAFDRNGFIYHGRIKALADGAREAGLDF
jgi:large subunit ribosomal protein L18